MIYFVQLLVKYQFFVVFKIQGKSRLKENILAEIKKYKFIRMLGDILLAFCPPKLNRVIKFYIIFRIFYNNTKIGLEFLGLEIFQISFS